MKKLFNILVLVTVALFLLGGCGGGSSDSAGGSSESGNIPPPDPTGDKSPPTISSTTPANGATNVPISTAITATLSEPIDTSTITTASFTLSGGITGTVTYDNTTATFTPNSNLANNTQYTATISANIKDSAGNSMASDYTWRFTTVAFVGSAPFAPTGVSAGTGNEQITISWSPVSDATSYNIYMASQSGVMKNNFAGLSDGMNHTAVATPYTHTGLTNGTTYYFVVTAVNSFGESGESVQVSATPTLAPPPPPI